MTTIKLGFVQFAPRFGELNANRRKIAELIGRAPATDLLVLPELCITGYRFENYEQAKALAEPIHRRAESVRMFLQLAKDKNTTIVAGYHEVDPNGRLFNSAIVVTPDGSLGSYRKCHLFLDEKSFFEPGAGLKTFDIPLREGTTVRLGVLICFDWFFPETWRTLMLMGAKIVAVPANLVLPEMCQRAVPVMAMMNRMAVVLANRYGAEQTLQFTGESLIVDGRGEELAHAAAAGDAVLAESVDSDKLGDYQITRRNHALHDRRPELYAPIADTDRDPPPPDDLDIWGLR